MVLGFEKGWGYHLFWGMKKDSEWIQSTKSVGSGQRDGGEEEDGADDQTSFLTIHYN